MHAGLDEPFGLAIGLRPYGFVNVCLMPNAWHVLAHSLERKALRVAEMLVLKKGNRLSITPVEAKHWKAILTAK